MTRIVPRRRARVERKSHGRLPPRALPFRRRLLRWYGRHRRDAAVARGDATPTRSWCREIMLQQTQVARVEDYWRRFVTRYPTVEDLAAAPLDAVRESWAGLGYYARARNLHATARAVVADHGGVFPRDPTSLQRLPGIGRYTADAVASLAFGADVGTVDTNIARVLARVFRLRGARKSARHAEAPVESRARARAAAAVVGLEPGADGSRRDDLHGAGAAVSGVPGRADLRVAPVAVRRGASGRGGAARAQRSIRAWRHPRARPLPVMQRR